MANVKKVKTKKSDLFEDEEFDIEDTPEEGHEDVQDLELEEMDINPEELEEPELESDPIEDLESLDDSIGIVDSEGRIIPTTAVDHTIDKDDMIDDTDLDEDGLESPSVQKNTVRICPHCNEEVLDMEVCPLCGNPLGQGIDSENTKDIDIDPLMIEFDEEQQDYGKRSSVDPRLEDNRFEDLFEDLPYQDKY